MNQQAIRQQSPLDNDTLQRYSPSVFATEPYHKVSERYAFVPTIAVLDGLRGEGWYPVAAQEQRTRLADKRDFTKHLIRLRHRDAKPVAGLDDVFPELVLINSHDRGSSYSLEAGLFRLACLNGLVVSDASFGGMRVMHTGSDIVGRVIEGAYSIVKDLPQIVGKVTEMHGTQLTEEEQIAYAESALMLRWDEGKAPVEPQQLLHIRRSVDTGRNVWNTYNRVQENIIKGGLSGRNAQGNYTRTRKVGSINEDTRINRALFTLAEKMMELKQAA